MNHRILIYTCALLIGIQSDPCGGYYTQKDFSAIELLTRDFYLFNLVFVENGADVTLFKRFREFVGTGYYYSALDSSALKGILENEPQQLHFFQKRSAIIVKERLNLTELLNEVLVPHYLTWIIFTEGGMHDTFYIPASCNVVFVNSSSDPVSVEQVYHPKRGSEAVKIRWSLEIPNTTARLSLENEKPSQSIKINFNNVTLDLHILYSLKKCKEKRTEITKKLMCINQVLLMLIGVRLNYSLNFIQCQEMEHPYTYPNGSDSELFLKLKNREVDFSSAVTFVPTKVNRRPYIDYVWPTFGFKSMMYLKQVRVFGRWATYLKPLEKSVWFCILACITITGVLIKIFEKLIANNLKFDSELVYELFISTFKALQVFCNQAVADISTRCSVRMIYVMKFFVVLIFFQAYCGYLVSSLTIVISRFPFTDFNGFIENQQYRVITLRKDFHQYFVRKVLLEGRDEKLMLPDYDLPLTIQEAVDRLCADDYLTLTGFREDLLNFGTLSCKISELPSPLAHTYFGIGVYKKTPLKEYLARELLHLRSTGLVRRLGFILSAHSYFHDNSNSDNYSSVSITQVFSIFILLNVGIGLSLIIFCLEVFLKKTRNSSFVQKRRLRYNRERTTPKYM